MCIAVLSLLVISPAFAQSPSQVTLKRPIISSNAYGSSAEKAIDGNIDTNYGANSCIHTNNDNGNWWKAKFQGGTEMVGLVVIHNRSDCCSERLNGAKILIGDNVCEESIENAEASPFGDLLIFECPAGTSGDYVKIEKDGWLHFCEVEVFRVSVDCFGTPYGDALVDDCGVCNGDNSSCESYGHGRDNYRAESATNVAESEVAVKYTCAEILDQTACESESCWWSGSCTDKPQDLEGQAFTDELLEDFEEALDSVDTLNHEAADESAAPSLLRSGFAVAAFVVFAALYIG